MKRTSHTRPAPSPVTSRAVRFAPVLPAAALAVALSGCSFTSPATVIQPYAPSNGVQTNIVNRTDGSEVALRDLLVVAGSDGRGQLIGAVVNTGNSPVQLLLAAGSGGPSRVEVPALGLTKLGPDGTQIVLDQVPAPGQFLNITAATASGGTDTLAVPVLPPTGEYATLTPPAPTAAAGSQATPTSTP